MYNKNIVPLIVVFLVIAVLIYAFRNFLQSQGFDWQVLSGGKAGGLVENA